MKKALSIVLSFILMLSLNSCINNKPLDSSDIKAVEEEKKEPSLVLNTTVTVNDTVVKLNKDWEYLSSGTENIVRYDTNELGTLFIVPYKIADSSISDKNLFDSISLKECQRTVKMKESELTKEDSKVLTVSDFSATIITTRYNKQNGEQWYYPAMIIRINQTATYIGFLVNEKTYLLRKNDYEKFFMEIYVAAKLKTNFFANKELVKEFSRINDFDYASKKAMLETYIQAFDPTEEDPVFEVLSLINEAEALYSLCVLVMDNFNSKTTAYYPELYEISETLHIVPRIERDSVNPLVLEFGFIKDGWLFFDKVEIKFEGSDKIYSFYWKSYETERTVLSGTMISEKAHIKQALSLSTKAIVCWQIMMHQ